MAGDARVDKSENGDVHVFISGLWFNELKWSIVIDISPRRRGRRFVRRVCGLERVVLFFLFLLFGLGGLFLGLNFFFDLGFRVTRFSDSLLARTFQSGHPVYLDFRLGLRDFLYFLNFFV